MMGSGRRRAACWVRWYRRSACDRPLLFTPFTKTSREIEGGEVTARESEVAMVRAVDGDGCGCWRIRQHRKSLIRKGRPRTHFLLGRPFFFCSIPRLLLADPSSRWKEEIGEGRTGQGQGKLSRSFAWWGMTTYAPACQETKKFGRSRIGRERRERVNNPRSRQIPWLFYLIYTKKPSSAASVSKS